MAVQALHAQHWQCVMAFSASTASVRQTMHSTGIANCACSLAWSLSSGLLLWLSALALCFGSELWLLALALCTWPASSAVCTQLLALSALSAQLSALSSLSCTLWCPSPLPGITSSFSARSWTLVSMPQSLSPPGRSWNVANLM
eukprot:2354235-Rhodomonas_salina.2